MPSSNCVAQANRMWRTIRKILVVAFLLNICRNTSVAAQECASETFDFSQPIFRSQQISLLDFDKAVVTHVVSGVERVEVSESAGYNLYLSAKIDGQSQLVISTTPEFERYAVTEKYLTLHCTLAFTCSDETKITIRVQVPIKEDENLYEPTFSKSIYEFQIPLPLPKDFDFSCASAADGGQIVATDFDLTDNSVTFAIEDNPYFYVETHPGESEKHFVAKLKTKATLTKLDSVISIIITGTDGGKEPKTGTAEVRISGDPLIPYIEPPQFQQSLYKYTYALDSEAFPIIQISLQANTFDSTVRYELAGEDGQLFELAVDANNGGARISLRSEAVIPDEKTFLSTIVTASRSGAELDGRTAIVVQLERAVKIVPSFEQSMYGGSVSAEKVITMERNIQLKVETNGEDVVPVLVGEDAKYFRVSKVEHSISLAGSEELTDEVLKEKFYFHFAVEARKADVDSGVAFVVLDVLKADEVVPKFEQLYYEGTITETGELDMVEVRIAEETYEESLQFTYSGDTDLFLFSRDQNKITITPNEVTEDKLAGKVYLLVKITASLEEEAVAETIVVIRVVRPSIVIPAFEHSFLQGQLIAATQELTALKVVLIPETFTPETLLNLQDSKNLFELKPTDVSNEFMVVLKEDVTIPGDSHLTLTLEATNPKSLTVNCFILIEVLHTQPVAPEFEQPLYLGQIDSNNQLEELVLKLKLGTYDGTVVFSLSDHDADLFEARKLDTNELLITLKETVSEEDLADRSSLRLNAHAKMSDSLETSVPVVIFIQGAEVKFPMFEKPLYKSRIGTDLQLVPFEAIKLTEDFIAEELELKILLSNTDLFLAVLNEELQSVAISLSRPLTPNDLDGLERFEFVVQVLNPAVGSGFTTILVDIVREVVVLPEFTAASYNGTIVEATMEMSFSETITLKDGTVTDEVSYQVLGEDGGLINLAINEDGSLKLTLREGITAEDLKEKWQLNFVVHASNPGSPVASTGVVVRIVRPIQATFTMPSFSGILQEGQLIVNFGTNQIKLKEGTMQEDTQFSPTGDDYELFKVSVQPESVIQVALKSTVNWIQIRNRAHLGFHLEASNPGSDRSYATIFVTVENNPVVTPVFTKVLYRGSLQKTTKEITFSASEIITLESDSITDTLSFRVIKDDQAMFDVTRDANKFKVVLKETVTEQDYEGRDLLSFQIEANNQYGPTDSTTVIIEIQLDEIISPQFVNSMYEGSIAEGSTEINLSKEITFRDGTFGPATTVGLLDGDSDWFNVQRSDSLVTISVKSASTIEWEQIKARNYLGFAVQATNPGSPIVDAFVTLEILRPAIVSPKFKSSSFQGYLEEGQRLVTFPDGKAIELEESSLLSGYTSELLDNDHNLFEHEVESNRVVVSLKNDVTEEQLENKIYLQFTVAITNPGSEKSLATVVVDLKRETIPVKIPMFEKTVYHATIDSDYRLSVENSIYVSEGTYTDDVLFMIVESNSDLIRVVQNQREAMIQLARTITAEDLEGLESIHLTIKAVNELAWSNCFLYVSLPVDENEPCTPLPPIIDCTDCYDCSTGEPLDDVPYFPYGNYRFHLKSDSSGMVGVIRASVKDPSITLEHVADISDTYLKQRITVSTDGVLRIVQPLVPNQYNFLVTAVSSTSQKQSTVNVNLDVTQDQECPNDPESPKIISVNKLLLIESLEEETAHSNIFPSQLADCEYELLDEKPFLAFNYFSIDPETHWLTAKPFDRENTTLFQNMPVPQFQLRLRLVCAVPATPSSFGGITKRSLIETDELNFARDVTVINVVVVDVNDNDPSFVRPSPTAQDFHLGFPAPSIAAGLLVPHLFTVEASDLDEGLNAQIWYSLHTEDDFGIDPENGLIFPLKNAMHSNQLVSLEVTATDRNGASDGRSSRVMLHVHRLEEDNLLLLTAAGFTDVESLITGINQNANDIQLRSLMEAKVPAFEQLDESRTPTQRQQENIVMRVIVYAFNSENILQDADSIKRVIQSSALADSITVETYQEAGCSGSGSSGGSGVCSPQHSCEDANVGLIAATSVLGALFLISTGFAMFLYFRYVRPTRSTPGNPSDIVQLENDFDISPPPSPPTLGAKKTADGSLSDEERKISIQITGITNQESEDSKVPDRLVRSLESQLERVNENDTVSSRATLDEPKNVKFNELVERIEVVEHRRQSGLDGDDDSIYNERL